MNRHIHWQIKPDGAPAVLRRCPGCEKQRRFIQSGYFRMNANQRRLDVWLIYKCEHCDATLNLDVYTRVEPRSIDPAEFLRLEKNDAELAVEFANDASFLRRNRATPDFDGVGYIVEGDDLPRGERCRLTIDCGFAAGVRLDKLLAERTGLSRGEVRRICEHGDITSEQGDVTKLKSKGIVTLDVRLPE